MSNCIKSLLLYITFLFTLLRSQGCKIYNVTIVKEKQLISFILHYQMIKDINMNTAMTNNFYHLYLHMETNQLRFNYF